MRPNILVVGTDSSMHERLAAQFRPRGWFSVNFATMHEAGRAVSANKFEVVLALESLPDGRGYELSSAVARKSGNLFVGVPLTESCLWLPVVRMGKKVLGERAVGPMEIGIEIEHLVGENCCLRAGSSDRGSAVSKKRNDSPESRGFEVRSRTVFAVSHRRAHLDQRPYAK